MSFKCIIRYLYNYPIHLSGHLFSMQGDAGTKVGKGEQGSPPCGVKCQKHLLLIMVCSGVSYFNIMVSNKVKSTNSK